MINISDIRKSILSLSKQHKKSKKFEQFINSFFSYIPLDIQKTQDSEELHKIAELAYDSFRNRKMEHDIQVITKSDSHIKIGEIVIIFLNDDMPFLVNSITECFNSQKYHIKRIINATFCVSRTDNGELIDIDCKTQKSKESLIYVKLSNVTSYINIQQLKDHCEIVLQNVKVAVRDWKKMSNQLHEVIENFEDNKKSAKEEKLFLDWVLKNNFIFAGSKAYIVDKKTYKSCDQDYGICDISNKSLIESITEDIFRANDLDVSANKVLIGKLREISYIHKFQNLDYICVLTPLENNKVKVDIFLGLFVIRLNYQSVSTIPIIREKTNFAFEKSGFSKSSFNARELLNILESLPKKDLLQMSKDEVYDTAMTILSCVTHPRLILFIRKNKCKKFIDVNVLFPRDRMTSDLIDKVQDKIIKYIPGQIVDSNIHFFSVGLAYISITINIDESLVKDINQKKLEKELDGVTARWNENLGISIESYFGSKKSGDLIEKYSQAFDNKYALKFSLEDAVDDIESIEDMLSSNDKISFKLCRRDCGIDSTCCFRIYGLDQKVALNKIMPLFDNLGFDTIEEELFVIDLSSENKKIWIQYFILHVDRQNLKNLNENKEKIGDAIKAIFYGFAKNDITNQLIFKAGFNWRQVFLINAYCKYLLQIQFAYSQCFIKSTLIKYPELSKLIMDLFYERFSPETKKTKIANLESKIRSHLDNISCLSEDKVMRKFVELIKATLRTNYFQTKDDAYKDYVSLKIDSSKISDIPLPKPFAEIFVYSLYMEGIHLRGGKISRGGIRWSDRIDDYRTEVLGLMKAQMTKNTIIVPDGSKGGFIVKKEEEYDTREKLFAQSIKCYQTFLRGMLDITDNLSCNKVEKPKQVVCRDGDDPYLVVAADKGTATFSDIANDVAKKEYNFWLGDAFASGGAVGYDHKAMGITAKGAWISVKHLFNNYGLDPQKDVFTAVGIGDMSGDVFGNGMLLSNKMKLIAAFNHMHIFVDPAPDTVVSYKERKRLFQLPRSTWDDYNKKLISKGGGVFERYSKTIKVSKEIKKLFDLSKDVIEPSYLIRAILTSKVDLIWNGGIGTYVKSQNEANLQIGNKSNDDVRVDASDLKCRVFAEGGNLGVTQLGRIEFAFNGGGINTDFIDNSGGVDCSDHEVNIKIVLDQAILNKKINSQERDKILLEMRDVVSQLVLHDNEIQNQNISIATAESINDLDSYIKLISFLEQTVDLNSSLEFLPDKPELLRRKQNDLGLSRPENAVLLAYSKRSVYNSIVNSKLPDDVFYEKHLFEYFPEQMRKIFANEIRNHPLRREIIATCITNEFVNYGGMNFYHIAHEFTGSSGYDIVNAFSATWEIFDLKNLWNEISLVRDFNIRIDLYSKLRFFMSNVQLWFLSNCSHPLDLKIIDLYKEHIVKIQEDISSYLSGDLLCEYNKKLQDLKNKSLGSKLAARIAGLENLYYSLDVIFILCNYKYNFNDILTLYFEVGEKFYYNWLHKHIDNLSIKGYWEKMLMKSIKGDIDLKHRSLVIEMMKNKVNVKDLIHCWETKNEKKVEMFASFIKSIMSLEELDYAKLTIAVRQSNILLS